VAAVATAAVATAAEVAVVATAAEVAVGLVAAEGLVAADIAAADTPAATRVPPPGDSREAAALRAVWAGKGIAAR